MKKLVSSNFSPSLHRVAFYWLKARPLKRNFFKEVKALNLKEMQSLWEQLQPLLSSREEKTLLQESLKHTLGFNQRKKVPHQKECLAQLLHWGADPNEVVENNLSKRAQQKSLPIVFALLSYNSNLLWDSSSRIPPMPRLHGMPDRWLSGNALELLGVVVPYCSKETLNQSDIEGNTLLHYVVSSREGNSLEVAQAMLFQGANAQGLNYQHKTPKSLTEKNSVMWNLLDSIDEQQRLKQVLPESTPSVSTKTLRL